MESSRCSHCLALIQLPARVAPEETGHDHCAEVKLPAAEVNWVKFLPRASSTRTNVSLEQKKPRTPGMQLSDLRVR